MSTLTRHYEARIGGISFGTRHDASRDAVASARRYFDIHTDETRPAEILVIANGKAVVIDTVEPRRTTTAN